MNSVRSMRSFRRFLCRYFCLHGFELIEINHEHEHGRCAYCGLEAVVDNVTREVRILMRGSHTWRA